MTSEVSTSALTNLEARNGVDRPTHLQIINNPCRYDGNFPQFGSLAPELRDEVWKHALSYERMIRVELWPGDSADDLLFDDEKYNHNRRRPSFREAKFLIVLRNRGEISKLFRVCGESRRAALRFYRVKMPCFYKQLGSPAVEGTFYFNPELDFARVEVGSQGFLPRFAEMLLASDPGGVGLVNLVVATRQHREFFHNLFVEDHDPEVVRQMLSRLRRVVFGYCGYIGRVLRLKTPARWYHWLYEEVENDPEVSAVPEWDTPMPFRVHRTAIEASVSRFERMPQDPRNSRRLKREMGALWIGHGDPREHLYRWTRLLEHWVVPSPERPVDYRFMISHDGRRVENRREALLALEEEEADMSAMKCEKGDKEAYDKRDTPSAYGFWLFPMEAFGPMPEGHDADKRFRRTPRLRSKRWSYFRKWDLAAYPPELCLQHLPEQPEVSDDVQVPDKKDWKLLRTRLNLWASIDSHGWYPGCGIRFY